MDFPTGCHNSTYSQLCERVVSKATYYSSALASMITRSEPHLKYLVMDKKLSGENVESVAQLKLALEKIRSEIPKELCMHLIESMPKHIRACVKALCGHAKY